jgi:PilZ domain
MADNEAINILLICREGDSRKAFSDQMAESCASILPVSDLKEYFASHSHAILSGIMVDMPTYMRFTEDEKRVLGELVEIFPAMRIKCNEQTGEIRTLPFSTRMPGVMSLVEFAASCCEQFTPRRVRLDERSSKQWNILLKRDHGQESPATKTASLNISMGGCFVVCFEPWNVGDTGWLTVKEVEGLGEIKFTVCWVRQWGEKSHLPGMGLGFAGLTESQREILGRHCHTHHGRVM